MAAALNIEQLKGIVECSICLEPYDTPKILSCTHHFCKACLDDVVVFAADGSGEIICPNRCPQKTTLTKDETVNDLIHCYDFKNLMEALKLDTNSAVQPPKCSTTADCTKDISVYCSGTFMCTSCYANLIVGAASSAPEEQQKKDLIFSKKANKMYVLCTKHVCPCTYLCMDNTFLCRYCAHRDELHKHHKMKLVEEEILSIKNALSNSSKLRSEHCSIVKTETLACISKGRDNLDAVLKARKAECLTQYTELLESEEKKLKEEYERICSQHMEQYSTEFFSGFNGSNDDGILDVQLAIEKEEILNEILWSENELPYLETVILDDEFGYLNEHPLGKVSSEKKTANGDNIGSIQTARSTLMLNNVLKEKGSQSSSGGNFLTRKLATDDRQFTKPDVTHNMAHSSETEQEVLMLSSDYGREILSKMSLNEGDDTLTADSRLGSYLGINPMDFVTQPDEPSQECSHDTLGESTSGRVADWLSSDWLSIFDATKSASPSAPVADHQQIVSNSTPIEEPQQLAISSSEVITEPENSNVKGKKKKKKKKKGANILLNPMWKINQTWLEISVNKTLMDRVVVDLFNEDAPNTCSTFVKYLTASGDCPFKYKGSRMRKEIDAIIVDPERTSEYLKKHVPLGKNKFEDSHDHDHTHNIFSLIMNMDSELGVFAILNNTDSNDTPTVNGQHVVFGEVTKETVPVFADVLSASYTDTKPRSNIVIVIANCGLI